jgi:hypothetical protein
VTDRRDGLGAIVETLVFEAPPPVAHTGRFKRF